MSKYTPAVEVGLDRMPEMARGSFDLRWMESNARGWGHQATPGPAGLRLQDVETGPYAEIPERGSSHGSMAPRGSFVPAETRSLGMYTLNDLSEVWSENAALLYDEAVVRQWNSVTDVPWHELRELPDDIERAVCQM